MQSKHTKFLNFNECDIVKLDDGKHIHSIIACDEDETCVSCQKCGTYYILCSKCKNLMQFLGHDDVYDKNSDNLNLDVENNLNLSKIGYSYLDENMYHVDQETIVKNCGEKLTGPEGGFHHYWKCNTCDRYCKFSDK